MDERWYLDMISAVCNTYNADTLLGIFLVLDASQKPLSNVIRGHEFAKNEERKILLCGVC